jgi:uncharacterized protein (TIGR00369 family)
MKDRREAKSWTRERLVAALAHGFSGRLGVRLVQATRDRIVGEMTILPDHLSDAGTAHGGVLMAFADTLAACGARLNLPPRMATTTLESKTNFLSPCGLGRIVGESLPVHVGRSTSIWRTEIRATSGTRLAFVVQTQMVLTPTRSRRGAAALSRARS